MCEACNVWWWSRYQSGGGQYGPRTWRVGSRRRRETVHYTGRNDSRIKWGDMMHYVGAKRWLHYVGRNDLLRWTTWRMHYVGRYGTLCGAKRRMIIWGEMTHVLCGAKRRMHYMGRIDV